MAKKPVKTIHPLTVAESLKHQNEKISTLMCQVNLILTLRESGNEAPGRAWDDLERSYAEAKAALWPDAGEE